VVWEYFTNFRKPNPSPLLDIPSPPHPLISTGGRGYREWRGRGGGLKIYRKPPFFILFSSDILLQFHFNFDLYRVTYHTGPL